MNLLIKDELYAVLKEPTLENFRVLLQNHMGEEDYLDFKKEWPSDEKTAKHILAMANSGGGCLIIGVENNLDGTFNIKGISSIKDTSKIKEGIKNKIPDSLKYHIKDFAYTTSEYEELKNKKFQILIVEDNPKDLPYVCTCNGKDIADGDIYVRDQTESIKANNYQIAKMLDRKINDYKFPKTKDLTLNNHLEHLKILYKELTYTNSSNVFSNFINSISIFQTKTEVVKKDLYPKEEYDEFIAKMLEKKKKRIAEELDV